MTSVTWKSAEILKVFGTTIREGTFTGSKIYPSGIKTSDSPTTFTPAKIAKIYENISTHVPIYLGHGSDINRRPIGYAYKFGVTDTLDDIRYNGFIFDKSAINKIATEGYDKVSPELSTDDSELLGLSFVPNPAIHGTDADMEIKLFSQGDTKSTPSMTEIVSNQGSEPAHQTQEIVQPVNTPKPEIQQVKETIIKEQAPDVSALVSQNEEYKTRYEQATAKIEYLLNQQYEVIAAEVKSLGIAEPEKMVRGLTTEQKISVLSKMKDSIVTTRPLASPTASTTEGKSAIDDALESTLKELGVSREEYSKITGKK